MRDEWTKGVSADRLVRFTYADLPDGAAFLTAQVANHEVVYSIVVETTEQPFSRRGVERHFEYEFRLGFADFSLGSTIDSRVGSRASIVGQKRPIRKPIPVSQKIARLLGRR